MTTTNTYLRSGSKDHHDGFIDFAFVPAHEIEHEAICTAFNLTEDHRVQKGASVYRHGQLELRRGRHYEIVIAPPPDRGKVDAAMITRELLHHWKLNAIILSGIGASLRPEVQLGDIVIGSGTWYYERREDTPAVQPPEPRIIAPDAGLWRDAIALSEWDGTALSDRPAPGKGAPRVPRAHRGVIAAGEGVVSSPALRRQIADCQRNVLAVEMSGHGLPRAAWESFDRVRHISIWGIGDDASLSEEGNWHEYAAAAAAQFARHVLLAPPRDAATGANDEAPDASGVPAWIVDIGYREPAYAKHSGTDKAYGGRFIVRAVDTADAITQAKAQFERSALESGVGWSRIIECIDCQPMTQTSVTSVVASDTNAESTREPGARD